MTRSQSRVRSFFREHPLLFVLALAGAALLVVAGAATGLNGILGTTESPESVALEATPTETSSDTTNTPRVSESPHDHVDPEEHRETGDLTEDVSCTSAQSAEQYAALVVRVLDYEEARLQPSFESDQATMRLYATETYVESHSRAVDPNDPTDLIVEVDREKSTVGCYIASDTRIIVQAWPIFSTYRVVEGGDREFVNEFTNPPVHTTGWLLVDEVWYVDSDIR